MPVQPESTGAIGDEELSCWQLREEKRFHSFFSLHIHTAIFIKLRNQHGSWKLRDNNDSRWKYESLIVQQITIPTI